MDQLQGLTFPINGTQVFQDDWNFEQESKSAEILSTRKDSFTPGIVSGGEISNGITNTVNIQPIVAYDSNGKRIESPFLNNFAILTNSSYTIAIRHKFLEQTVIQPNGTTLIYRSNSYEIVFRTGSLSDGDIALYSVSNSVGVTSILADLRVFRKVIDSSLVTKINLGESLKGLIQGRLEYKSNNTTIYVPKWNLYDVKGKFIQLSSALFLDFSLTSNIFRADGNPISSIVEIQNKHLYLLLSDTASLSAQIIDDSEMSIGSHSYLDNVKLCEDYYKPSPLIFNPSENGFYKSSKRIIAVLRISSANSVEFWYELGFGHRFLDVSTIPVGQGFSELRWKREHPNCYIPNGDTITTMATDAPELFRIYGSNILPNWSNRFARNIDLSSDREIRDLQEDALQEFYASGNTLTSGSGIASGSGSYNAGGGVSIYAYDGSMRFANETRPVNYSFLRQIVRA